MGKKVTILSVKIENQNLEPLKGLHMGVGLKSKLHSELSIFIFQYLHTLGTASKSGSLFSGSENRWLKDSIWLKPSLFTLMF